MLKRTLAVLLVALLLVGLSPMGLAEEPDPVDAYVDKAFRGAKTVGGSVVVYHKGELVYARDYGYSNLYRKVPVDENTYFRTASITKMITGIGLMHLVEDGKLSLDEDISTYFGYKVGNPGFPKVPITLRQLMSHTGSISEKGGYSINNRKVADMLTLKLKRASNFHKAAPGSKYVYSNFGAGLTGAIIEAVTKQSINTYMTEAVFAPLGIEAAYAAGLLKDPEHVSSQYQDGKMYKSGALSIKDKYEDFPDPEAHFRTTIGNAWMRSRDMAKLTALLCAGGELDGVRLLKPETVAEMMQEQYTLGQSVTGESPYGLFLEHNTTILPDKTVYGHQGMSNGAILNTYYEPDAEFAFVLFVNGASTQRINRVGKLARNLINYLYPLYGE